MEEVAYFLSVIFRLGKIYQINLILQLHGHLYKKNKKNTYVKLYNI